jgi:cobalt/nickel transport system permease protein
MHAHFLDPYRRGRSLIHQLDPRVKFVLALAFILTTALTPIGAWPIYILLLACILSVAVLSELGIAYVLKRAALALPFMLAALPVIFTIQGPQLFSLSIGGWTLQATLPGLERFISIALKSWISVQAAIILATTTPFPDLMVAMRAVHVPRLLVAIFGLMWRYLFVFADEVLRLMRARQARSGVSDQPNLKSGGGLAWRGRVAGGMAGSLFLRAFERSDRIYMAMMARGYDGEVRAAPLPPLRGRDWLALGVCLALFVILLTLATLLSL